MGASEASVLYIYIYIYIDKKGLLGFSEEKKKKKKRGLLGSKVSS